MKRRRGWEVVCATRREEEWGVRAEAAITWAT